MTILFLISSEGHYGVENMLVTLARNLAQQDCRCIVAVFRDSRVPHTEVATEAEGQGLPVEIIPCNGRWDWNAVVRIRELLVKHDVHVLHPHGYKADLYGYVAAWPNRVALVSTAHNWPSPLLQMRAYAALDRLVLRRFDRVIAISDVIAGVLQSSGIQPRKIETILNGVEIERFQGAAPSLRDGIQSKPQQQLVGFVGRLVKDKGGEILLKAAQKVLAVHLDTTFVFVGDGPSRKELEEFAMRLGIRERVSFVGVRNDMPGVYASFDVVVLPSLVESVPMCLLEAMAASKPVIATRVGAVPKIIIPEETGLLLQPGDVEGLAAAISRLLTDAALARRLGENGCEHVRQHFSATSMAKAYLQTYAGVLASREGAQSNAALEVSRG